MNFSVFPSKKVRRHGIVVLVLILVPFWLRAEAPAWWLQRGVINPNATADDYAAVNQGQVKHIAKQAYDEFNDKLSGGAGAALAGVWENPAASSDDYRAVNLGQLKNVAKPFYDRLAQLGYVGQPLVAGQTYPWSGVATQADDYALANIGQVKNLFSFPLNALVQGYYISIVAGDQQVGPSGQELPQSLKVRVVGANGQLLAGQAVVFAVTAGSGSLASVSGGAAGVSIELMTGVTGEIEAYFTPVGAAGAVTRVSATLSGTTVVFTGYVGSPVVSSGGTAEVPVSPPAGDVNPGGVPETTVNDIELTNPGSPNFKYPVLTIAPDQYQYFYGDEYDWRPDATRAKLSWTDGSFEPGAYRVEVRIDCGEWKKVADVSGSHTYIHAGLIAGRLYEYRVLLLKQRSILSYTNIMAYDVPRVGSIDYVMHSREGWGEDWGAYVDGGHGAGVSSGYYYAPVNVYLFAPTMWEAVQCSIHLNNADSGTPSLKYVRSVAWFHWEVHVELFFEEEGDGVWRPGLVSGPNIADASNAVFIVPPSSVPLDASGVAFVDATVWTRSDLSDYFNWTGESSIARSTTADFSEYIPYFITFHGARISCYSLPEDGIVWDGGEPITIERSDYRLTGVAPLALTWASVGSTRAILLYKQVYDSSTQSWSEPQGPLPKDTQLQPGEKFVVKLNPAEASLESVKLTLTDSDVADGVSTTIKYSYHKPSAGASIPLSDACGAKYRKIALNGAPLSDDRPQQEEESDQSREETFIDALTLGLRHDTTDTYYSVPSADLFLGARRSVTSEIWTQRHGIRPAERPDRPFGAGWTTNLAAGIQFTRMLGKAEDAIQNPDTATVTDENGATYSFAMLYQEGDPYDRATGYLRPITFVPLPGAGHEQSTYLASLVKTGADYVFTRKYGSTLTYVMSELKLALPADRIDGSSSGEEYTWARLSTVVDRYGNMLTYSYAGDNTLIPATIRAGGSTGLGDPALSIRQNSAGLITDIWDPSGRNVSYTYSFSGDVAQLTGVTATDGSQTTYSYTMSEERRDVPDSVDPNDEPRIHLNLTGITDPLGHAYSFAYNYDSTRYGYTSEVDEQGALAGQNHYVQPGAPMYVMQITLPGGHVSHFDNQGSVTRLVRNPITNKLEFQGNRQSKVIDALGNERDYDFTDVHVEEVEDFASVYHKQFKFNNPRVVYYQTMTITPFTGSGEGKVSLGSFERFTFSPYAGMSVASATDFSGNTTSYSYTDPFAGTTLFTLSGRNSSGIYGFYSDPTAQTNAVGQTKSFTYGPKRIMTSSTDENGVTTQWQVDSIGRRTAETVAGMQDTTFDYGDPAFANFVTQKTVHKQAGAPDPAWVADLVTAYVPDARGHIAQEIVDPTGLHLVTSYTYDANGNKITATDPLGNTTHFSYDARNRLTHVTHADHHQKRFFYDQRGNKIKEVDEEGVATLWVYDTLNRVMKQAVDMNGNGLIDAGVDLVTSTTYNALNAKLTVTDPNGGTTSYSYDALQRLISKTDALNHTTVYTYGTNAGGGGFNSSGFKPTQVTDPRGYHTQVTYDALYRSLSEKTEYRPGLYATTTKTYDNVGNLLTVTDPLGSMTSMTYDALRRPLTVTEGFDTPLAATATRAYTSTGFAWKTTDGLNRVTHTDYDAAGRPVLVHAPAVVDALNPGDPVSPVTETLYDEAGNVRSIINPLGQRIDYTYDHRNRRLTELLPAVIDATRPNAPASRPVRTTAYDGAGNVIAVQDARGFATTTKYDPARRPVEVTAPPMIKADGSVVYPTTRSTYDAAGNILATTDANGHVTTNTYDALNRLLTTTQRPSVDPAAMIVVTHEYDAAGNRTAVIDGKLQRTEFTYDGFNRNLTVRDPANHIVSFEYDAMNKIARVDAEGRRTDYVYDARHRLTQVTYAGRTQDNRTYAYDLVGQLLSVVEPGKSGKADVAYAYDNLGRQLTETSGGRTHAYAYDLAGNRVSVAYGGTGTRLISDYDSLNRLKTLTEGTRVTTYGYDLNGNRVRQWLPDGEEVDTSYDALNRAVAITTGKSGGTVLLQLTQTYDPVGNLVKLTERHLGSMLAPRTVANTYDAVNRLVNEVNVEHVKTLATTYVFDSANNRTAKAVATTTGLGTTMLETAYTYNSLNQLQSTTAGTTITSYAYDLNGNRKTRSVQTEDPGLQPVDTYTYDYENRLVGLTKNTEGGAGDYAYVYDYRSRRVARTEVSVTTDVVFSGGVSVAEYEGGTPSVASAEYIRGSDWGGGVGGLLYSVRSGVPSFKHYNSRGDVISATDATGAATWQGTYEAYGIRTQEVGSTPDRQKANTKEEDPTGLLNEGFRYRDLETGVFITRDPLGFVDGPNLYAYVVQNPWSKFDPEGLKVEVKEEQKKDPKTGQVTTITHITLTGKVLDQSSAKRTKEEQQKLVDRITKEIKKDYTGKDKNHSWDIDVKLTLAKDEKDISKDDHVFRIVDKVPYGGGGLTTDRDKDALKGIGGSNMYISSKIVPFSPENRDARLPRSNLEETSAHEFGHALGLRHDKSLDPQNPIMSLPYRNLMNPSPQRTGMEIDERQIDIAQKAYNDGELNK